MKIGILTAITLLAVVMTSPAGSIKTRKNSVNDNVIRGRYCSQAIDDASPSQELQNSFEASVARVNDQILHSRWGSANVSSSPATSSAEVKMYGQCYMDSKLSACSHCFRNARKLSACLPSVSAAIFFDGCYLRYALGGRASGRVGNQASCGGPWTTGNEGGTSMKGELGKKVRSAMELLTQSVVSGAGFGYLLDRGGVKDIYAVGQCWNHVTSEECRRCVDAAGARLYQECGRPGANEGRAMFENCFVRYSTSKFFDADPDHQTEESQKSWIISAGILSSIVLALLVIFAAYIFYKRVSMSKGGQTPLHRASNYRLHFKYETLEKATDFFHSTRKLGQGGSGSVFKGILPDGRVVAVKRLFFSTRQWADEFFNEINLINGIDHKNLVKLLGCSIEGPESLLVYEFVPNCSLDQVIFDRKKTRSSLTWQERYDIILGIAEGLAFLHGGCGARIIHRDIKASNVLLGDNLIPKIADFGLARSVASDKSHLSTGIAGTLGYMAPEYLVRGQLTEKADLYAFGVLVLEIVCGRRNSTFTLGSNSILHKVWKLHKDNKISESVDKVLKGDFDHEEASNVLQIGLLCTQASVLLRPSMSEVIKMLSNNEREIPTPKQPPFMNASLINAEDVDSSTSFQIPSEISCSFTENSSTLYESMCYAGVSTSLTVKPL